MATLVAIRNYLLVAAAIAVLSAIPVSERLKFDQRIESFFAPDNPDIRILERSRQDFGSNEFVIIAWTEPRLFDLEAESYPASLEEILQVDFLPAVREEVAERIESLAERFNALPGVNAEETQHLPGFINTARDFKPLRREMLRVFEGTLVGQDGRTTGILLELQPEDVAGVPQAQTLEAIREIAAELDGDVAVAGEPVQVNDMFQMVEQDGQLLFLVSLAILSLTLLLMFRGLRWVLAPVGLVLGTVVATRATLVLLGAELSMVSSMLNSLVTVIGIATCMHVIVHYRDLRNELADDSEATQMTGRAKLPLVARRTLKDMAAPVFWTYVTTAVGFASLLVSQITPVRSFAIMMCLAILIALIGGIIILPATLGSGSRLRVPATVPLEKWLDKALHLNCRALEEQPVGLAAICFLLFAVSLPGVLMLSVETDFSKNFKEDSTIVQALQFVETRLGGAGSWEVSFDTPEKLTKDFLNDVRRLTEKLEETNEDQVFERKLTDLQEAIAAIGNADELAADVTEFLSQARDRQREALDEAAEDPGGTAEETSQLATRLTDAGASENVVAAFLDVAAEPIAAGRDKSLRILSVSALANIPPRLFGPVKTLVRVQREQPNLIRNFYNSEAHRMRIVLRSFEQQSSEDKLAQISAIRRCVREHFREQQEFQQQTRPEASGMFVLLAELIQSLLADQLKSFLIATVGILCCMTIAFGSLRIGLISLFPNIFPVAVVMGTLGWIGEPVNIGTAMITSVSMGLTVDSTIHYITAFERAREHRSVTEALMVAHSGAGRAVVLSHIALVAGFMVLTASRFVPLVYFGALLSLSMIGGIFGDLVLLPLLLRWATPEKEAPANSGDDVQTEQLAAGATVSS